MCYPADGRRQDRRTRTDTIPAFLAPIRVGFGKGGLERVPSVVKPHIVPAIDDILDVHKPRKHIRRFA
jgi:hypothetical protein